jgi:hypothetical protein
MRLTVRTALIVAFPAEHVVRPDVGDRIALVVFSQLADEPGNVHLGGHAIGPDGELAVHETPVEFIVRNAAIPSQSLFDPLRPRFTRLEQDHFWAVQESMSLKHVGVPYRAITIAAVPLEQFRAPRASPRIVAPVRVRETRAIRPVHVRHSPVSDPVPQSTKRNPGGP